MRIRTRQLLLILGIILLSGISGWLLDQISTPEDKKESRPRHDPDFFMENFTATTMDTTGKPRHELRADLMKHYPDDDTSELTRPRIKIFQDNTPPWHVDADRGWVSADGKLILLIGNVHASRKASAHNQAMSLTTEQIRLRPDDHYAETDKAVKITSGKDVTSAIGMRAYLKEGRLQLLSRARGRYEAPKRK